MKAIFPQSGLFLRTFGFASAACVLWGCGGNSPAPEVPVHSAPSGSELFERGETALAQGDTTRAEQYLKLALEQGYRTDETVLLLVQTCLSSSRFRAALNYAEPHLQNHPDNAALRYLVAAVHMSLNHELEARRELNLLAERSPHYADTYYLRGVIKWQQKDASATDDLSRYLDLAPQGRHAPEVRSVLSDVRLAQRESTTQQSTFIAVPRRLELQEPVTSTEGDVQ